MEKSWAKKYGDSSRKSWPPQSEAASTFKQEWQTPEEYKTVTKECRKEVEEIPDGGIKKTSMESSSTLEKRSWSTKQQMTEKIMERPPSPPKIARPIIYNAETIKVDHTVNKIEEQSLYEKYTKESDLHKKETSAKIEEYSAKSRWTGSEELKTPSLIRSMESSKKPVVQLYHLAEPAPATESITLEPGPAPEIGYIPPPYTKEKKIERIEKSLEISMEQQPAKIPPGAIRTIPPLASKKEEPPVLPPKDVRMTPPPIPAKQPSLLDKLEPFPFEPSSTQMPKPAKLPPPPMPSKFVKGTFGPESDYESDLDAQLKPKWRPYESDGEEPRYRRVKAPVPKQPTRPRSTEPEPLPPSKFEVPPSDIPGPPRPVLSTEMQEKTCRKTTVKRQEKEVKQQQKYVVAQPPPVHLKPGSPPIYVQPPTKSPTPKSPPAKKPDSPKFKVKTFQQESGYMADTDEPLQQKASMATMQKTIGKHESSSSMTSHMEAHTSYSESRSEFFESKSFKSHQEQKTDKVVPPVTSVPTPKPIVQQQRSTFLEKSSSTTAPSKFKSTKETVYTVDQSHKKMETMKKVTPPCASPSKFAKGEFRESDYESDYDGRIPPLWKPRSYESDDQTFRSVKPTFAGPGIFQFRNLEVMSI